MFNPDFVEDYDDLPLHDVFQSFNGFSTVSLKKINLSEAYLRAKAEARLGKATVQGMTLGEIISFLDGE